MLPWTESLLDAFGYLHGQHLSIIYQDIKPQNLKLTAGGGIVLLDFGLAKAFPTGATAPSSSLFGYTP